MAKRAKWHETSPSLDATLVEVDLDTLDAAILLVERELPRMDTAPDAQDRILRVRATLAKGAFVGTDVVWILSLLRGLDRQMTATLHTPVYVGLLTALFTRFDHEGWRRPEPPLMAEILAFGQQVRSNPFILWQETTLGFLRRFLDYVREVAEGQGDRFLRRLADDVTVLVEIAGWLGPR